MSANPNTHTAAPFLRVTEKHEHFLFNKISSTTALSTLRALYFAPNNNDRKTAEEAKRGRDDNEAQGSKSVV